MRAVRLLAPLLLASGALVAAQPVGAATPTCGGRTATIVGTTGDDRVVGTPQRDVIVTLRGDDVVSGRGGDDLVCGGRGADTLLGGRGADTLRGNLDRLDEDPSGTYLVGDILAGGRGADLLLGGWDQRTAESRRRPDTVTWVDSRRGVVVDLTEGTARGEGPDTIGLPPVLGVHGSRHDDRLLGSERRDVLTGDAGDDTITAGDGNDAIYTETSMLADGADADNDVVNAGSGDDLISSQLGRDKLAGGDGRDFIEAYGQGPAAVEAGRGRDYVAQNIVAAAGMTSLGGTGVDTVVFYGTHLEGRSPRVEVKVDLRTGTTSADIQPAATGTVSGYQRYRLVGHLRWLFRGTPEADRVWAITGGPLRAATYEGPDTLTGSDRPDLLRGGAGVDTASGNGGKDTCYEVERGGC